MRDALDLAEVEKVGLALLFGCTTLLLFCSFIWRHFDRLNCISLSLTFIALANSHFSPPSNLSASHKMIFFIFIFSLFFFILHKVSLFFSRKKASHMIRVRWGLPERGNLLGSFFPLFSPPALPSPISTLSLFLC